MLVSGVPPAPFVNHRGGGERGDEGGVTLKNGKTQFLIERYGLSIANMI